MNKTRTYKHFLKNYFILHWWAFGILLSLACVTFITVSFPLWSILLVACIAFVLLAIGVVLLIVSRCTVDAVGITVPISYSKKRSFAFSDIDSVKITCSFAYLRYHVAYIIELKCGDFVLEIKTLKDVVDEIINFSKDCDNFQRMFLERLKEAENSY